MLIYLLCVALVCQDMICVHHKDPEKDRLTF